jgi:hypothetical protein
MTEPVEGEHAAPQRSSGRGGSQVAHPLLRPFPLVVMGLATFLVIFALLMARLTSGLDPALRASPGTVSLAEGSSSSSSAVRTTASGRILPASGPQVGRSEVLSSAAPAVLTRASGGVNTSGAGDE